jgi:cytochrome c556
MRKIIIFSICFAIAGAAAIAQGFAQEDPVAARQKLMKSFGAALKPIPDMLKGAAPFDLAVVQKALATIVDGTKELPNLYPEPPKPGEKSRALPKIWEEKARFVGTYEKLGKDAAAALPLITDEASLKANFGKVAGNCKTCHDEFRKPE